MAALLLAKFIHNIHNTFGSCCQVCTNVFFRYTLYLYCMSNAYLIHKTNFHCGGQQTFVLLSEEDTHDLPTGTKWCIEIRIVSKEKQKKSTISMRLWGSILAHQSGICRRPFHWSVSGRWSCSSRDCGGGRTGHKTDCTRVH